MSRPMPVNLSSRKRVEWVLYRHGFYVRDGLGICDCGEWPGGSRGTWEEHVTDLIEEVVEMAPRVAAGETE